MLTHIIVWGITVTSSLLLLCYILDRVRKVKHNFGAVTRPKELSRLLVNGNLVPSSSLYLAADKNKCDTNVAPVLIIIPGNPGVAEFYIETMEKILKQSNGTIHVYCIGHLGQGLIINDDLVRFSPTLPDFDFDRVTVAGPRRGNPQASTSSAACFSNPFASSQLYNLRDQIAQKIEALRQIRKLHPQAKGIYLAGHSVGAHICLEMLRTLERLLEFAKDRTHCPRKSTERVRLNGQYDEAIALYNSQSISEYENAVERGDCKEGFSFGISKRLFSSSEMEQWLDLIATDSLNDKGPAAPWLGQIHLLCPTVHRIAYTPNGFFFTPLFQKPILLNAAIAALNALPGFLKRTILNLAVQSSTKPEAHAATRLMLHSTAISNIVYMATAEMKEIGGLDRSLVERNVSRLRAYYAGKDGWVPKEFIPICTTGFSDSKSKVFHVVDDEAEHAFVMFKRDVDKITKFVWNQIYDDLLNRDRIILN